MNQSSYCLQTRRSMVDNSRFIGEAPMRMMNPSVMVLDWISWLWNLRRLDVCFIDSPRVSGIFGNLLCKEGVREVTEVGTTHLGAPGEKHLGVLGPIGFLLVHKNSPKSFATFRLYLVLILCEVKNNN